MPPAPKRDLTLILFDLKSSKKDQLLEGLIKLVTYKSLMTKDESNLFLVNSQITSNSKNVENVFRTCINNCDPKTIFKCINNAKASDGDTVDFLDVLLLAIYYVEQAVGMPGIITLQITYFTTLENQQVQKDERKISKIIQKLNEREIYLYIVGPDVEIPDPIAKKEDIPEHMKKIMFDESNPALVIANHIVQQTPRSILAKLSIGINLALFYKKARTMQPWQVPISIGSLLNIPAKTTRIYRADKIKLQDQTRKTLYKSYVLKEDENVEVAFEDLIKGVFFHKKFIKIENEDMFKSETARSFTLVGFTSSKFVSEPYIGGDSTFVVVPGAQPGEGPYDLFVTLVQVLKDQDKCAIMQRIYNKNNKPKFFVLKPELGPKGPNFIMTNLPYADDIKGKYLHCSTPEKSQEIPSEEEDDVFTKYCRSIDIYDDTCAIEVPLSPLLLMDQFTDGVVKETARQLCSKDFEFIETEPFDYEADFRNEYVQELLSRGYFENSELPPEIQAIRDKVLSKIPEYE